MSLGKAARAEYATSACNMQPYTITQLRLTTHHRECNILAPQLLLELSVIGSAHAWDEGGSQLKSLRATRRGANRSHYAIMENRNARPTLRSMQAAHDAQHDCVSVPERLDAIQ